MTDVQRRRASQPFQYRVSQRKWVAAGLLASLLPMCLLILVVVGPQNSFPFALGIGFGLVITTFLWLLTLDCPSCQHPVFWSDRWKFPNWGWIAVDRCGNCDRTWPEIETHEKRQAENGAPSNNQAG